MCVCVCVFCKVLKNLFSGAANFISFKVVEWEFESERENVCEIAHAHALALDHCMSLYICVEWFYVLQVVFSSFENSIFAANHHQTEWLCYFEDRQCICVFCRWFFLFFVWNISKICFFAYKQNAREASQNNLENQTFDRTLVVCVWVWYWWKRFKDFPYLK